jgi:hypothetical protein
MPKGRSDQFMKAQSIALATVTLLAGVLIGVVGTHSFQVSDEAVSDVTRQQSATDTPAAKLRASLNTRMVEHVYLTEMAVAAAYRKDPSLSQRFTALEKNADQLAAESGILEGTSQEELRQLGQQQVSALRGYAVAARRQNPGDMRRHRQQLSEFTNQLAGVISQDLDMSKQHLKQSLQTHIKYMERILNARAAGNYQEARKQRKQAKTHMQQLSDELAADISSAYPEEFE